MAGESQATPKTEPDPSVMTTEQLDRGLASERDYVDLKFAVLAERLAAIDKATELLSDTVTRGPTDVQIAVSNLKELHGEKFASIATQFAERDTRSERESRDNKVAVDAAFAAQKEAAAKEGESNQKAIDKSETGTTDSIAKLNVLFSTSIETIKERQNDLGTQLTELRSLIQGGANARTDQRLNANLLVAIAGLVLAAAIFAFAR